MHGHHDGPGDKAAEAGGARHGRRRPGWDVWLAAGAVAGFLAWLVLDLWHMMAVDNLGALAAPLVAAAACRRRARVPAAPALGRRPPTAREWWAAPAPATRAARRSRPRPVEPPSTRPLHPRSGGSVTPPPG